MKRFSIALLTAAVAAVLFSGTAQAAPVPWTFNWTPVTNPASPPGPTATVLSDNPGSFLTISNEPGRTVTNDHTFITATNISVTSNAPVGFPDEFTLHGNVAFNLFLKDNNSGASGNFLFTGTFDTMNPLMKSTVSADSSNLQFTPTGVQSINPVLGHNEYDVHFYSYTPPGPPGSGNKGSIAFQVTVRNLDIQKAPEPSTMLLAGLGASFMSFSAWRKRRKQVTMA
jgi:hypothetical protein